MLWKPLQFAVFFAVMAVFINYPITDNGQIACVTAGFAAMAVTWITLKAMDWYRFGFAALGVPPALRIASVTAKTVGAILALSAVVVAIDQLQAWLHTVQ